MPADRRPFHLLAKPTGAVCNLDCTYCFFLSKDALYPGESMRMHDDVLVAYLTQMLAAQPDGPVNVAWQGGEPTLMGVAAGATALGAYLIGDVINAAYVDKNLPGIVTLAIVTAVIFTIKGAATYGQATMLARIGNRIVAQNQRRMFTSLVSQNIDFFSNRHSSEFMVRLQTGATSASAVINLLVTAIGRDLLSLIGLIVVMAVQDPIMSFFSFVVAPPAFIVLRKMIRRIYKIARNQFTGSTKIMETMQETVHGIRIVKAFTLDRKSVV